jgi:hypothetical protein
VSPPHAPSEGEPDAFDGRASVSATPMLARH